MVRIFRAIAASILLAWVASAKPVPDGFSALVDKLSPGVVNIATERANEAASAEGLAPSPSAWDGQIGGQVSEKNGRSLGSGFVIDPAGLIVTVGSPGTELEFAL